MLIFAKSRIVQKLKVEINLDWIFIQAKLLAQLIHAALNAVVQRELTILRSHSSNYKCTTSAVAFCEKQARQLVYHKQSQACLQLPEIDLVILSSQKDLDMLPDVINACRAHSLNKLREIFVIAKQSSQVMTLCSIFNVSFVDENTLLPLKRSDILFVACGVDRSGWIWQQLLKLGASTLCKSRDYAVIDADTVLLKKHVFSLGRYAHLFYLADELHIPYRWTYSKLTGLSCCLPLSCVSHGMSFDREMVANLIRSIEAWTMLPWYEAIINLTDKSNPSAFSEYETYANFVSHSSPAEVLLTHSANLSVGRSVYLFAKKVPVMLELLSIFFKSISGHEKS
jgi:hypothetical protein